MAEIAQVDKNVRYYNADPAQVAQYAKMAMDFDAQK